MALTSRFVLPSGPVLFLDAASPAISVGLQPASGAPGQWRTSADEAGVGLFRTADELLSVATVRVSDLNAVVFCEGPGSLLGVRIAAMAIRTWCELPRQRPLEVFAYRSLELIAACLLESGVHPPFSVISDARRASWNVLPVSIDGAMGVIARWPIETPFPATHPLYCPASFPRWQTLPAATTPADYRPELLPALAARYGLLRRCDAPDAFLTEVATYRTWSPEIANTPTAPI